MTVSREEMLASAIEELIVCAEQVTDADGDIRIYASCAIAQGREALAALRAAAELDHRTSGEPVAWLVINLNTGAKFTRFERATATEDAQQKNWNAAIEPLYTASSLPGHQSAASHSQEIWRHKKRGTTYTIIGRGKLQSSDPTGLGDNQPMVVYRSEADGSIWVRPTDEFEDGRFERVASQAGSEASSGADAVERSDLAEWAEATAPLFPRHSSKYERIAALLRLYPAPEQAAQGDVAETALDQSGSSKP